MANYFDNIGLPVFKIQVQRGGRSRNMTERHIPIVAWWNPLTISSPVLLGMILLPIAAIVSLELLQRASDRDGGLLTLRSDYLDESYIHYIPALAMLLIATLFSSLDFNIALFTPFSAMRSGNSSSRRTMTTHLLGKTPPLAIYEALRSLQIGALLSLVGALVGSVLTVFVSGLYSVELLSSDGPTRSLSRLDNFNLNWTNSYAADNGAAATLSLIEHLNLSYPDFTYGELAFPRLALGELDGKLETLSLISGSATATGMPLVEKHFYCSLCLLYHTVVYVSRRYFCCGRTLGRPSSIHFRASTALSIYHFRLTVSIDHRIMANHPRQYQHFGGTSTVTFFQSQLLTSRL